MVLQCDECNLFFRTEDKFNNHKQGLMGLHCEGSISNTDKSNSCTKNDDVGMKKLEETIANEDSESLVTPILMEERESTEIASLATSFVADSSLNSWDKNSSRNTDKDVQNNEVTSSKEPTLSVMNSREDSSIMISDNESSDEETEYEQYNKVAEDEFYNDEYRKDSKANTPKAVLNADIDYNLVCVHIETFKASNESSLSLTQVGCTTALNVKGIKETFFQPIKPARLVHFLNNFKMEGDLLKSLHMTDENGKFEFRGQFEMRKRKEKNKIFCTTEEEALDKLTKYLEKFENVILFAVDEQTLEVILGKLAQFRPDSDLPVSGFTTWSRVLDHCLKFADRKIYQEETDLEDFYSQHYGGPVSGYITALDVANFLRKSIKKLCSDYANRFGVMDPHKKFSRNAFIDEVVEDIKNIEIKTDGKVESNKPLTVEVFSSFRPAVSTTIGIEYMDTVELSSGEESEDSDIDILEENLKPKRYTKKRSIDDPELLSRKRKYPYDFPEYPLPKRPNFSEDPIMISSGSEDEEEEITLDEELSRTFPVPGNLDNIRSMLERNTQLRVTKMKEGSWLGKTLPVSQPKCCICHIEFEDTSQLESHTEREHMHCKVCNLDFNVLAEALAHKKSVHGASENKKLVDTLDEVSDGEFSDEEKLDTDLDNICKTFTFSTQEFPVI